MPEANPFKPVSEDDKKALTRFVKPDVSVESLVPDEIITANEVSKEYWDYLTVICKQISRTIGQTDMLLPVLGKMLLVAQAHPEETYVSKKIEDFEAFISYVGEKFHVGRTTCYEAKGLAERWSSEVLRDFAMIGRANFKLINKCVAKGDEKKSYARKLLDKAREGVSFEELEAYCVEKGLIDKGEAKGATFTIKTNKKRAKEFKRWFAIPEVQAMCQSDKPDVIFECMIQECSGEWMARGAEVLREQEQTKLTEEQKTQAPAEA